MNQHQIEDVFWRATVMCLGLDPDAPASQDRVRISWPKGELGNSDWKIDEDVVFLRVSTGTDPYGTAQDVLYIDDPETGEAKEVVGYQRSIRVNWVCYGPNADESADRIRIGLHRDAVHSYLIGNNIAVQPHIREPVRVPEPDDAGEWWERSDLFADCYEGVVREYPADTIDVAPEINILNG